MSKQNDVWEKNGQIFVLNKHDGYEERVFNLQQTLALKFLIKKYTSKTHSQNQ